MMTLKIYSRDMTGNRHSKYFLYSEKKYVKKVFLI